MTRARAALSARAAATTALVVLALTSGCSGSQGDDTSPGNQNKLRCTTSPDPALPCVQPSTGATR